MGSFDIVHSVYEFGSLLLFKYLLILVHMYLFYYHVKPSCSVLTTVDTQYAVSNAKVV